LNINASSSFYYKNVSRCTVPERQMQVTVLLNTTSHISRGDSGNTWRSVSSANAANFSALLKTKKKLWKQQIKINTDCNLLLVSDVALTTNYTKFYIIQIFPKKLPHSREMKFIMLHPYMNQGSPCT